MGDDDVPCCQVEFWVFLVMCFVLVLFAGISSGLALGLLSFSEVDLEVLVTAGQPRDQKNAAKILPVVKNAHLVLCTLLVCKCLAMEALPVFLDSIVPTWGAIVMSAILVTAFSEIIPQAVCSRHGLTFGAKMSTLVRFLVILLFPISYPISKVLDWFLGKDHSELLRRAELKKLVDLHGNEAGKGGELSHRETTIISGALDLTEKTAKDVMTPMFKTFSLDVNSKLDKTTMEVIVNKGHSRIPIYSGDPTNIIGLILAKSLIFCRPEDETPVRNLTIRRIPRIHQNCPLYDVLNLFQKGQSHMAAVIKMNPRISRNPSPLQNSENDHTPVLNDFFKQNKESDNEAVGIITMEDVMEELLQEEILDETDEYVDVQSRIRINLLHPRRSSSRSPWRTPGSRLYWRTPASSPLSSSVSPVSPYVQASLVRPNLHPSPGKSTPCSPDPSSDHFLSLSSSPREETLDGTEEHVDAQNKIRINLLPSRRSPSRSPWSSRIHWRTLEPSPLSPHVHASLIRPNLHPSPGISTQNSPSPSADRILSLPPSPTVPRVV